MKQISNFTISSRNKFGLWTSNLGSDGAIISTPSAGSYKNFIKVSDLHKKVKMKKRSKFLNFAAIFEDGIRFKTD